MTLYEKEKIKEAEHNLILTFCEFIRALNMPELETKILLDSFNYLVKQKFDTYEHRIKMLTVYYYMTSGILIDYSDFSN